MSISLSKLVLPAIIMLLASVRIGPAAAQSVHKVQLHEVSNFVYNIQNVDTPAQRKQLVGTHFDMYILEPCITEAGNQSFDIADLVRDIRDHIKTNNYKNPIILAYVDIGQAEDWRWYWQGSWDVGNPEWIVGDDPDGWSGCYPVAYWYSQWEDYVIYGSNGMSFVESALAAGFDGIYMDWVEAFSDTNVTAKALDDGVDPVEKMFDFIEKIRTHARVTSSNANSNFLVIAQNASDLYEENTNRYESLIDGIALEGIWYDGDGGFDTWSDPTGYNVPADELYPGWQAEVLAHLDPMKGRMPIFCVEYAQDINGTNRATEVYTTLAPGQGFVATCTRRSLAQLSTTPYPPSYLPHDYFDSSSVWFDAAVLSDEWKWLSWFGYFNTYYHPWMYHNEHGWLYCSSDPSANLWLYSLDMGWLYTSGTLYPWIYRQIDAAWLWYQIDSASPRWFYNAKTDLWESR